MPRPDDVLTTTSVCTVFAVSGTKRLAFWSGPFAVMVHGPGGILAYGLTEPGAASFVTLPGAPAAQLQWKVTFD